MITKIGSDFSKLAYLMSLMRTSRLEGDEAKELRRIYGLKDGANLTARNIVREYAGSGIGGAIGAAGGGVLGGLAGLAIRNPVVGAAIGAGLGTTAGGLVGGYKATTQYSKGNPLLKKWRAEKEAKALQAPAQA